MRVDLSDIPEACLIDSAVVSDERGSLTRVFEREWEQVCLSIHPLDHALLSFNAEKFTLRGFHYQRPPFMESKVLSCVAGSIFDVVVDLRRESPTFLDFACVKMDEGDGLSLHVPPGCANAWLTTAPNSKILYFMGSKFVPESAGGFRFDDAQFCIEWPAKPLIVANKDLEWPPFDQIRDSVP